MQLIFLLPGQDGNVAAILNNINVHFFYGRIVIYMSNVYEKKLLKLSLTALKKGEVPISAMIVRNGKIISKAYNRKNLDKNSLYHAEILCLQKAYKKLKRWNLNDCTMYVTLEPCSMCKNLIEESRIQNVFYILEKGKCNNKYKKTKYEQMYVLDKNSFSEIMDLFFKKIRK